MQVIDALQLDIDSQSVAQAVLAHPRIKLKPEHVKTAGPFSLVVFPNEPSKDMMFFSLQNLRQVGQTALPEHWAFERTPGRFPVASDAGAPGRLPQS